MALQSLNAATPWPRIVGYVGGASSVGTWQTLTTAGHYASVVIAAHKAMTITHVGFRTGAVSGAPTADVRIEDIAATGLPSGTLWDTNTNIVTGALSANTHALHALTASAAIDPGQRFAVKIAFASGTSFIVQQSTNIAFNSNIPYSVVNTGADTKDRIVSGINLVLGSGATTFYSVDAIRPFTAITANTFSNSVAGTRRGLKFQVPFKCRCVGVRYSSGAVTGDYSAIVLDSGGTELSSSATAYDGDESGAGAGGMSSVMFDNPVTLSPATTYYIMIEPTSATNCGLVTYTLPSADYRTGFPGGTNFNYATYTTGGGFTDVTDQVPVMDILYDQLEDGVSAGGGGQRIIGG
jgi:hypothetical protein